MASYSLLRTSTRPEFSICARCTFRASQIAPRTARRWIGIKYLTKVADAEMQWQEKAISIRAGKEKSMLRILEERGLVHDIAGKRDAVDEFMTSTRVGAYVGIDPTASSLHIGHMLPLMCIFWMYVKGYHAVSLLGGATAKIGDPTDRLTTRDKEHASTRTANMLALHFQLKKLWVNVETYGKKYDYNWEWAWHRELVNNNAWWNKLPMLEVLQILGPGMRMGTMMSRDTVKNKMSKGDGMSWAEFTYPLLQAWDWWHMYNTKGIHMQIGGSDQFGNITAGIEAVKYVTKNHPHQAVRGVAEAMKEPFGFTVPLLTTSSGAKFGKSAGNAVWLDQEQTSVFDLYGYFLRTSDADVGKYLKMFTFMPLTEIDALVAEHMTSPTKRKAQHMLAREFVELVHGVHEAKNAEQQHRLLFSKPHPTNDTSDVAIAEADHDAKAGITTLNNAPSANITLPQSLIFKKSIGKVLFATGLVESASEGHRLAGEGGVYIGGRPDGKPGPMNEGHVSWDHVKNWEPGQMRQYLLHENLLFFRKGKHNIRIVKVVSDDVYKESAARYPGMDKNWDGKLDGVGGVKESNLTKDEDELARKEQEILWQADQKERKAEIRRMERQKKLENYQRGGVRRRF